MKREEKQLKLIPSNTKQVKFFKSLAPPLAAAFLILSPICATPGHFLILSKVLNCPCFFIQIALLPTCHSLLLHGNSGKNSKLYGFFFQNIHFFNLFLKYPTLNKISYIWIFIMQLCETKQKLGIIVTRILYTRPSWTHIFLY